MLLPCIPNPLVCGARVQEMSAGVEKWWARARGEIAQNIGYHSGKTHHGLACALQHIRNIIESITLTRPHLTTEARYGFIPNHFPGTELAPSLYLLAAE